MMAWLTAPLQYDFMQMALAIAVVVAIPTALLSCILVLKGWALLGDAIAHGVFPGVVLAYLAGWPLVVGAFTAGMLCAQRLVLDWGCTLALDCAGCRWRLYAGPAFRRWRFL